MNLLQNKIFTIFFLLVFAVVTIYYAVKFFNEPQNQTFNIIAVLIGLLGVGLSFRDFRKSKKLKVKAQNEEESTL